MEVKDSTFGLSQQAGEAEGSLTPEAWVRAESSLDNDGTGRHSQTARARLARREGVREKPASESLSSGSTGSNLGDVGRYGSARTR